MFKKMALFYWSFIDIYILILIVKNKKTLTPLLYKRVVAFYYFSRCFYYI